MERFRIEVGHNHNVMPGNIVGAIANEANVDSRCIGRVDIRDDYSLVDLPAGMSDHVLSHLKKVWVVGHQLRIVPDGQPFDPPRKPGKLTIREESGRDPGARPAGKAPRKFTRRTTGKSRGKSPGKSGRRT